MRKGLVIQHKGCKIGCIAAYRREKYLLIEGSLENNHLPVMIPQQPVPWHSRKAANSSCLGQIAGGSSSCHRRLFGVIIKLQAAVAANGQYMNLSEIAHLKDPIKPSRFNCPGTLPFLCAIPKGFQSYEKNQKTDFKKNTF